MKHALTVERSEHTACIRGKCGLMQLATTPPGRGVYRNLICIRLGTEDLEEEVGALKSWSFFGILM